MFRTRNNTFKNGYIFHRGLKYFSKVSCHRPTAIPGGEGGGGGEGGRGEGGGGEMGVRWYSTTQQFVMLVGSAPRSNLLLFIYEKKKYQFCQKRYLFFVYFLLNN